MAVSLTGCMVGPDFQALPPPAAKSYTYLPMPQKTTQTVSIANAGKSQRFVTNKALESDWWRIFHSQALNQLVQEGLSNNQDLVAAKAALRAANDTLYAQIGGLLLPSLDFNGTAQQNRINGTSFGTNTQPNTFNVINASFQTSYLLDVWGASRRQIETYAAQADFQRYQMLATYLTLTTNIVTTAISIASLQEQIKTTQQLIQEQKNVLRINQSQFSAGGISQENVLTQQTLVAQTEATLPPLLKSLSSEQHALAVLVGAQTNAMSPLRLSFHQLSLPAELPMSLPSSMITQRPDIQASEATLHAASAQVGVATANLLPQVTLNGVFGWQSSTTAQFFNTANQTWSLGAGLLQPLFHGGQLIYQRRAAIEALAQARAQYEQTVLQAFQNVADALRAIQYDASEFKAQVNAEKSAKQTLQLTQEQYRVGGQNYLSVLQAEQQYQQIVLARVKAQAARYTDTAALYQTLGGGWWNNTTINHYGVRK
ncbi:MAG: RND transporter [Coxiella sp. RIFCSPHIGHO2_12_FULL_42_15]|nr:MAG: RND transporter [Coxiella sp. RIFCSPHIGHO2_12_FULL_42_15]